MSSRKSATPPRSIYLPPVRLSQALLIPYLLSLFVHVGILVVFGLGFRGCERGPAGFSNGPDGPIGLEMAGGDEFDTRLPGDPQGVVGETPGGAPGETTGGTDVEMPADSLAPTQSTSDTPPAEILLPSANGSGETPAGLTAGPTLPFVNGVGDPGGTGLPGTGLPGTGRAGTGGTGLVPGVGRGQGGTGGGVPGAAFMGARDVGSKVVFVIDASGSMTSNNAMAVAKSALMSSLQALDERQQFLVIFYDDEPHVVALRQEAKPALSMANDINKTLARQAIAGIRPGSGTNHLPALEVALRMNPDVIFFLTDALEPPLWPRDLEAIRKINGGRARIHSIEFGQGPELEGDAGNFLKKLAYQNQGTYRYHDVTRFRSPQSQP